MSGMKRVGLLLVSHVVALSLGFVAGVYFLPILTAPDAPSISEVRATADKMLYKAQFRRDLKDSDALHWGEGTVYVGRDSISLEGKIAPGPDYKIYLSPEFVETEADFNRLKSTMVRVGDVRTFENFIVPVPESIDPQAFSSLGIVRGSVAGP